MNDIVSTKENHDSITLEEISKLERNDVNRFDSCATWSPTNSSLPDRDIALYFSPHKVDVIYAVIGGFGTSHLYRSENRGDEWLDIGQGLPNVPTNAIIADPEDHCIIYIGNDLGVWVSIDYGKTWSTFKKGMPTAAPASTRCLMPSKHLRIIKNSNKSHNIFFMGLL